MNAFTFKPAAQFTERAGVFVSLTGGTCSGKSFSSLRLAKGLAGNARVAAMDTEGGRLLHLKGDFDFDIDIMSPPFHPARFADGAKAAEDAGYGALVIDSFSQEWVGLGGVLDWQAGELERMAGSDFRKQERVKLASWIKPKMAHKAMVYGLLQRRIPIIFSIRGEETIKPGENGEKPTRLFKSVCNSSFPFEMTIAFRLDQERKGYIDLSDPKTWKLEQAHHAIFRDGDRISEEHGAALAEWARGAPAAAAPDPYTAAREAAEKGVHALRTHWEALPRDVKAALKARLPTLKEIAERAAAPADDFPGDRETAEVVT